MNDRYLYRAKHVHAFDVNKKHDGWVYGFLSCENYIYSPELGTEKLIDPSTICQCTGLKDEDGKKIFEGEIVGYIDCTSTENGYSEHYCRGLVAWDEETASFQVTERLSAESYEVLDRGCNVLGNIFDNPELMEVGE